jgi:hypothetical protein
MLNGLKMIGKVRPLPGHPLGLKHCSSSTTGLGNYGLPPAGGPVDAPGPDPRPRRGYFLRSASVSFL